MTATHKFNRDVIQQMIQIILKYLSNNQLTLSFSIVDDDIIAFAQDILNNELSSDIDRFVKTDPATKKADDPYKYVFESYKGVKAILYYRIANYLIYHPDALLPDHDDNDYKDPFDTDPHEDFNCQTEAKQFFYLLARKISEDAAILTGIEINPSAQIGKGSVIDHGLNTKIMPGESGTVIGETCEIGENCTILNGVTLGASEVNTGIMPRERRHPKIGTGTTICANVRVLGPVNIGNNVFISPFSVVTHDIPDNYTVSIINQLQIERNHANKGKIKIYGLIPSDNDFWIVGENLSDCIITICDTDTLSQEVSVKVLQKTDTAIKFTTNEISTIPKNASLCIQSGENRIYYLRPNINFNRK